MTRTAEPTRTRTVTPTHWPTPTRGLPPTITPSPKEECPPPTHAKADIYFSNDIHGYGSQILNYFQAHGGRAGLDEQLRTLGVSAVTKEGERYFPNIVDFTEADLTGDSVREVIITIKQLHGSALYDMAVFVVGCRNGNFRFLKFKFYPQSEEVLFSTWVLSRDSRVVDIRDLNANGIQELAIVESVMVSCCSPADMYFYVFEWDGDVLHIKMGGMWPFTAIPLLRDIDGNGTIEVLVPNYNPESNCDSGPVSKYQEIYMWDGEGYRYMWRDPGDPEYRFQAAFYGDYFAEIALYGQAEEMYRRAILDLSLKNYLIPDWTKERPAHSCARPEDADRTEPQRIVAYARFRLLELNTYLQDMAAAESGYAFLTENYTVTTPGYRYASLGITFWKTYATEHNMDDACTAVRDEAAMYTSEVFGPMIYGYYYPGPSLDTICPFHYGSG